MESIRLFSIGMVWLIMDRLGVHSNLSYIGQSTFSEMSNCLSSIVQARPESETID